MDILVLNNKLEAIAVVDSYETFTWTDRYNAYGDFELHTSITLEILEHLRQDYYIQIKSSEHTMIVDEILIESSAEGGNTLKVAGKSLESILNRRIVWGQATLSGNLQREISELLTTSIINPSKTTRKIDNFIFEWSDDPLVTELTVNAQYTGDNIYDVVSKLCQDNNIGFKITLNDSNQFVFKLYAGADRSYDQTANPYVVFSQEFDNLIKSNYLESRAPLKNVTLIAGEDSTEGYYETDNGAGTTAYISSDNTVRKYVAVGDESGLTRRELFTDARDISSETEDETKLSDEEYAELLRQRGREKLAENKEIVSFEGEIEPDSMFKINEDYFIGDIVQIANEYGHTSKVRILEIVTSDESGGLSVIPTFETITEEGA